LRPEAKVTCPVPPALHAFPPEIYLLEPLGFEFQGTEIYSEQPVTNVENRRVLSGHQCLFSPQHNAYAYRRVVSAGLLTHVPTSRSLIVRFPVSLGVKSLRWTKVVGVGILG